MYGMGLYGFYGPYPFLLLASILFTMYASYSVKSSYNKNLKIRSKTGMTGEQVARRLLDMNGLNHVKVVCIDGFLSDHYDHKKEVISLSRDVFQGMSISAVSVAAHEVGHAIQKKEKYTFFLFRDALARPVQFASSFSWIIIITGILVQRTSMALELFWILDLGIVLFSLIVLFHLVTLPVEINASSRAISQLVDRGIIFTDEKPMAKSVLRGAAMTYVASLSAAIVQLVRLLAYRNNSR